MIRVLIWGVFALAGLMPVSNASADLRAILEKKLTPDDGAAWGRSGTSVAVSGIYAVFGAPGSYYQAGGAGVAYVFKRENGVWTQQQKLTSPDPGPGNAFGSAVAISDDTIIVGADMHRDENSGQYCSRGAAYIFKLEQGIWSLTTSLTIPLEDNFDLFGLSVAVSGNHAAVSAPYTGCGPGKNRGAVYMYKREGKTWAQHQILTVNDGTVYDTFGRSVSVSGDYMAAGFEEGSFTGSVYVYKYDGAAWVQQAKLGPPDGTVSDEFGLSVAISGNHIIAGAYGDSESGYDSGAAYMFKLENGAWTEQAKLTASDPVKSDNFGFSVAIDGNTAAVGTRRSLDGDIDAPNFVYIYRLENGTWKERAKLYATDNPGDSNYGTSVAVSGSQALVGAKRDNVNGKESGAVYVYELYSGSGGPCPVTITTDLSFEFPNARYRSLIGNQDMALSFKFAGEKSGKLLWEITDMDLPDLMSCSTPIAPDLSFTVDNAAYYSPDFGIQNIWAGFEFFGVENGKLLWEMVGAGGK